jgi:hypothetical protein
MKYLESFNNIKDFCEEHLAYILDDGYIITTNDAYSRANNKNTKYTLINISLYGAGVKSKIPFYWKNIRDYIIPFLFHLSKKYNVGNITLEQLSKGWNSSYPTKDYLEVTYSLGELKRDSSELSEIPAIRNISIKVFK